MKKTLLGTSLVALVHAMSAMSALASDNTINDRVSNAQLVAFCSDAGVGTDKTAKVTFPDGSTVTGKVDCGSEAFAAASSGNPNSPARTSGDSSDSGNDSSDDNSDDSSDDSGDNSGDSSDDNGSDNSGDSGDDSSDDGSDDSGDSSDDNGGSGDGEGGGDNGGDDHEGSDD